MVAKNRAIKRHMILDGAIKDVEPHFVGPVPDEGDYPAELEGSWCIDGTWTDPKRLSGTHGVHEETWCVDAVDETECHGNGCNALTLKCVDKMKNDVCRLTLVCMEMKNKGEQLGEEDVL